MLFQYFFVKNTHVVICIIISFKKPYMPVGEFAALGLVWLGYRESPLANTMNARGVERGFLTGRGDCLGTGGGAGNGFGAGRSFGAGIGFGAGRSFGAGTAFGARRGFGRSTGGSASEHDTKRNGR